MPGISSERPVWVYYLGCHEVFKLFHRLEYNTFMKKLNILILK